MEHLYVTAETVCLVSTPTQVNAFRAVGLANVLTAVAGVGDEVDADHGCQCCPPRGVPMLAHDGLQLRVFENEPIESRERHWLRVGDFQDWVGGSSRSVEPPSARGSPTDHKTTRERSEERRVGKQRRRR